jgi:hypothetical protein
VSDVDLDAVRSEARREALDMIAALADALSTAIAALETMVEPGVDEYGAPVDWPLPDALTLERMQLAAFVATVETLTPQARAGLRERYAAKLEEIKLRRGHYDTFELSTCPALPETRAAYEGLLHRVEDLRRAALLDRELRDALRHVVT